MGGHSCFSKGRFGWESHEAGKPMAWEGPEAGKPMAWEGLLIFIAVLQAGAWGQNLDFALFFWVKKAASSVFRMKFVQLSVHRETNANQLNQIITDNIFEVYSSKTSLLYIETLVAYLMCPGCCSWITLTWLSR